MVLKIRDGQKFFDKQLLFCIRKKEHEDVLSIIEDVDVKNLVDSSGMTLLHHAVNAGDVMTVKYLIERGCEVDALDTYGNTPLLNAMNIYRFDSLLGMKESGFSRYSRDPLNFDVVSVLLDSNANIFLRAQDNRNSLQIALLLHRYGGGQISTMIFETLKYLTDCEEIVKVLLINGCLLPQAMLLKDPAITKCMLDKGCGVHDREPFKELTALHCSVDYMDLDNVRLLIDRGASFNVQDKHGDTPADYYRAGMTESLDILITLLQHDNALNALSIAHSRLARKVLAKGQLNEVEALLTRYNFDFEDTTYDIVGHTLLHSIAENTNPGVIELLEDKKMNVDEGDRDLGLTALGNAAFYGNFKGIDLLLKRGANPNLLLDGEGVEWHTIFSYGFDVWVSDFKELSIAVYVKCVELFLEYGADVLHKNEEGTNAIFAIYLDYPDRRGNNFPILQPIIAQVAMMEAMGQKMDEYIPGQLKNDKNFMKYFNMCEYKIKKLQKTWINKTTSLFQFLTESEGKLLRPVRNDKSMKRLEQIIRRERHSKVFFIKRLRNRIRNILEIAKLREEAALSMIKLSGCGNRDVIDEIIFLLDKQSLQNLCEV